MINLAVDYKLHLLWLSRFQLDAYWSITRAFSEVLEAFWGQLWSLLVGQVVAVGHSTNRGKDCGGASKQRDCLLQTKDILEASSKNGWDQAMVAPWNILRRHDSTSSGKGFSIPWSEIVTPRLVSHSYACPGCLHAGQQGRGPHLHPACWAASHLVWEGISTAGGSLEGSGAIFFPLIIYCRVTFSSAEVNGRGVHVLGFRRTPEWFAA